MKTTVVLWMRLLRQGPFIRKPKERVLERNLTPRNFFSVAMKNDRRAIGFFRKAGLPVLISFVVSTIALGGATYLTLKNSKLSVSRYISVWEEEIARQTLLSGERDLFEKVQKQIADFAPEVTSANGAASSDSRIHHCEPNELTQTLLISLYGTPAATLSVCRSFSRLLVEALQSPLFLIGIFIGSLILFWHIRRVANEQASLASARMLEELSKQVAHDIRSPLGALRIVGSRMHSRNTNPEDQALFGVLQASIQRISQITEDLLSAGVSKSNVTSPATPTQVNQVIQNVVNEMKLGAEHSGVELIHKLADDSRLSEVLVSEERQLSRVVSNLIQNAIDAPRDPEVQKTKSVVVATRRSRKGFEIEISDNGQGIPIDSWSVFGQRGFTKGKANGNGLGVAHAREWSASMGGTLRVRSSRLSGTSIVLTLPQ